MGKKVTIKLVQNRGIIEINDGPLTEEQKTAYTLFWRLVLQRLLRGYSTREHETEIRGIEKHAA